MPVLGRAIVVVVALAAACGRVDYQRRVWGADGGEAETRGDAGLPSANEDRPPAAPELDAPPAGPGIDPEPDGAAPDAPSLTPESGVGDAGAGPPPGPDAAADSALPDARPPPPDAAALLPGLRAEFFAGVSFNALKATRVDRVVDFDWGAGSPDRSIPADDFTARWTGTVTVLSRQTYTFHVQSAGGVRLWVANRRIIDNWGDHALKEDSGAIELYPGRPWDIRLEFVAASRDATVKLSWSSLSLAKQVIPADVLAASPSPIRTYEAEAEFAHLTGGPDGIGWSATARADPASFLIYGPDDNDWPAARVEVNYRVMIDPVMIDSTGDVDIPLYLKIQDTTDDNIVVGRSVYRSEFGLNRVYVDLVLRADLSQLAGHRMEAIIYWYGLCYANVDRVTLAVVP